MREKFVSFAFSVMLFTVCVSAQAQQSAKLALS
jgi:hypothetical protein